MADELAVLIPTTAELAAHNSDTVAEAFYTVEQEIAERIEQVQNNEWMLGVLLVMVEANWTNICKHARRDGDSFDAWACAATRRQKRTWRKWMDNAEAYFVTELGRQAVEAAGGVLQFISNVSMEKADVLRPHVQAGEVADVAVAGLADPSITSFQLQSLIWGDSSPNPSSPVNGGYVAVNTELRAIELHWDNGVCEPLFILGSPDSPRGKQIQRQVLAFLGLVTHGNPRLS